MARWLTLFTNLFPIWVLMGGALALVHPPMFTWFGSREIVWGLALIMLGMGITLSLDDFKSVLKMPRAVGMGFAAQYTIMPLLGWGITHLLNLSTPFAVGVILVACCPGGTASNVVTYLARGHVALSVLMTMCSTFGAIILTPLLTKWLAGTLVPVNATKLLLDTVQVVLVPVLCGIALNQVSPRLVKGILPIAPPISVITIALICASIIGTNASKVKESGMILTLALFLLHSGGFALGYLFAHCFGYDRNIRRTVAIEVGMQNSGLGAVLARSNFADPLTAVPCAISATFHSVIGSLFAGYCRLNPISQPKAERATAPVSGVVS